MKVDLHLSPYTKLNKYWGKVIKIRTCTVSLIEEKVGNPQTHFHRTGLFEQDFDTTDIKTSNKQTLTKLEHSCAAKTLSLE